MPHAFHFQRKVVPGRRIRAKVNERSRDAVRVFALRYGVFQFRSGKQVPIDGNDDGMGVIFLMGHR